MALFFSTNLDNKIFSLQHMQIFIIYFELLTCINRFSYN